MSLFQKISETWGVLNRSIYTGSRLKENLKALSFAGAFFAVVGIGLTILDLAMGKNIQAAAAFVTFLFGGACTYCASVLKRRELAIIMPVVFCMVMFTIYTFTGAGEGSFVLWSFTLPIGICYFVSVKYGILLSLYYILLFAAVFYTPLGDAVKPLYSELFVSRFPLVYASTSVLTAAAMVQYHRGILLENEYAERLHTEVEKQTAVATMRAEQLEQLNDEIVQTLAVAIDAKDGYTNGHSTRVSMYSVALARQLGWENSEINELEREAMLHDIGKIGIPDAILNKPGKLSEEEYSVIKSHTVTGGSILSRSENLNNAAAVARHHHERYDGTGYPDRLAGEQIPLHARVVAIADAFDAMHSDRVYRKGMQLDVIRKELVNGSGRQFDPQMLEVFLRLFDSGVLEKIAEEEIPQMQQNLA